MYTRIALSALAIGLLCGLAWMLASDVVDLESEDTPASEIEADIPAAAASVIQEVERTELDGMDEGQRAWAETVSNSISLPRVLVEVTTLKGEAGHPPEDCQGWEVLVRYRRALDGPSASRATSLDKNGRVEIRFIGMVMIDRITCIPPQGSGLGFAVEEQSVEFLNGEKHSALLYVTPAQSAVGKVVNHHGEAVPNASIHVFPRKQNRGLRDWSGGILTTTTDANGHFRFDQIPNGAWVFAVQPTKWLMYSPGLKEQSEGHGLLYFYGEQDDATDVGVLGVVPMSVVQLKVTDSNDAPAAGVIVGAIPIKLDDPNVKASEEDDFSSLDDILLPYAHYYFQTDANGEATLRLADGQWDLRMMNFPGIHTLDYKSLTVAFTSHEESLHYQIPAPMIRFAGKYVGPDGEPISKARFSLGVNGNSKGWGAAMTRLDGSFAFPSILSADSYQLSVRPESSAWLSESWTISSQAMGKDFRAVATPSAGLRFMVRDLEGLPIQQSGLSLRLMELSQKPARAGHSRPNSWARTHGINRGVDTSGVQEIRGLTTGEYILVLFSHPDRLDPITGVRPEAEEVRRWTLQTGDTVHELRVAVPR